MFLEGHTAVRQLKGYLCGDQPARRKGLRAHSMWGNPKKKWDVRLFEKLTTPRLHPPISTTNQQPDEQAIYVEPHTHWLFQRHQDPLSFHVHVPRNIGRHLIGYAESGRRLRMCMYSTFECRIRPWLVGRSRSEVGLDSFSIFPILFSSLLSCSIATRRITARTLPFECHGS